MDLSKDFSEIRKRLTTIGDAARAVLNDLISLEYRLPEDCDPVKGSSPNYPNASRERGRSSAGSEIDTQQNARWTVLPSLTPSESISRLAGRKPLCITKHPSLPNSQTTQCDAQEHRRPRLDIQESKNGRRVIARLILSSTARERQNA